MPTSPAKPCLHPGCPALVTHGNRCPDHASQSAGARYDRDRRAVDPALAQAARIRSSAQWQKVRALHRRTCPLCCDPFGDHPFRPRFNVNSHHIEPLAQRPDLALDLANLAPLCTACHGKVEAMERAGHSTRRLFLPAATGAAR